VTDPQRLVDELTHAGWIIVDHGRDGSYQRLAWPGLTDRTALFVPLDTTAPDFRDLWQAALAELEDAVATGVQAAHVLAGLHPTAGT
jgi:hypothetical protein